MKKNISVFALAIIMYICVNFFIDAMIHCEGFGCIGVGIINIAASFVGIPLIFGIGGYIFFKENRIKQSLAFLGISLVAVVLVFWISYMKAQMRVEKSDEASIQSEREQFKEMGIPETQFLQRLDPLSNQRPITITHPDPSALITAITEHSFKVQAYAREDAMLSDGTLQVRIWADTPQSTEQRDIARGSLLSTQKHSADGRTIFEGILLLADTSWTEDGYISVYGKDGVFDSARVSFK